MILCAVFTLAVTASVGTVRSIFPGAVCTELENPSFEVSPLAKTWRVTDWRGDERQSGACGNGFVTIKRPLSPGYWTLTVDGTNVCTFTVVVDPAKRRKVERSPIGVDSGFSWCASPGHFTGPFALNAYENVAAMMRLAGITETRERMSWCQVQPKKEAAPNWKHYFTNAELLKRNGIRISGMFHDSPDWTQSNRRGLIVSRDLRAVYDFCRKLASDFGDRMDVWEYWNEQDNTLSQSPVWEFMAAQKAASLGFHAAGPGVLAANGATCAGIDFGYDNGMFENDLAKYTDVFNTHVYSSYAHYPTWFGFTHAFLGKYGADGLPIMISECNMDDEGPASVPTDDPKQFAHTPEQEMFVADFTAKSQIVRLMGGVWRTHFFLFGARTERNGRKDWGLLRRDGTAKPGVAAYAALTEALEGLKPLGRADVGPDAVGYLFEGPGEQKTLAYWSRSSNESVTGVTGWIYDIPEAQKTLRYWRTKGEHPLLVKTSDKVRLRDWCGTPRRPVRDGEIVSMPIEKSVSYVTGDFDFPILERATPIPTPKRYVPPADEDVTVVIAPYLTTNDVTIVDRKSVAEIGNAGPVRLTLALWNFSDVEKRGVLMTKNGRLSGFPGEIVLPPQGVWKGEGRVMFETGPGGETRWEVSGLFNGKRTTKAAIRVRNPAALLAGCNPHDLGWHDVANWKANDSGSSHAKNVEDGTIRFDVTWKNPKADRWVFPILTLTEGEGDGARFLEFEIRNRQDKVENDFSSAYVFFGYSDGNSKRVKHASPSDQWEKVRIQVPSDPDPAKLRTIQIGGKPKGMNLSLWLRNVRLLRKN